MLDFYVDFAPFQRHDPFQLEACSKQDSTSSLSFVIKYS